MRNRMIYLFIGLFFSQILYAQNADLSVQLTKNGSSERSWQLQMQLNFSLTPEAGLLVEFPGQWVLAPGAIYVNDTAYWLKQSANQPTADTVVHWDTNESGLILYFKDRSLQAGDRLQISCAAHLNRTPRAGTIISVKNISRDSENNIIVESTIASRVLAEIN